MRVKQQKKKKNPKLLNSGRTVFQSADQNSGVFFVILFFSFGYF